MSYNDFSIVTTEKYDHETSLVAWSNESLKIRQSLSKSTEKKIAKPWEPLLIKKKKVIIKITESYE